MKIFRQNQTDEIVAALCAGSVVALPTETVYGLATKYDNAAAIDKLAKIKNRTTSSGKIFTLMLPDVDKINDFALENALSRRLAKQYFPGELTFVLPKNPKFRNPYFDQFDTIGIRIPAHDWLLGLLKIAGPLIVTSANQRGAKPAITSDEVQQTMPDIDTLITGKAGGHQPSTVAQISGSQIKILRHGELEIK
ncbi:MAG: threonylcarbamoyl-AMP synthase [Candidatus Nomurabacteria bacterium]|jgi:L-threonylcarbamoyladenylate synthase|nr:threonylcarbamoyl-AMP synthase [Candidatus Nomurabacteria bacterium]